MTRLGHVGLAAALLLAARASAAPPQIEATLNLTPASTQAVAYDGVNYLVVWSSPTGIWATRVSPSGAVLDPAGIFVATGQAGAGIYPPPNERAGAHELGLAFVGGVYLVAWAEWEPLDAEVGQRTHLYAVRLDSAGTVLDPSPLLLTATEDCTDKVCEDHYPTVEVGQDGANFLISGEATFVRIAAVVAPTGELLSHSETPSDLWIQSIAFGGSRYYLAACTFGLDDVVGTRLGADGNPIAPELTLDQSLSWYTFGRRCDTSVAFDGSSFFVTWIGEVPGAWVDPYAVYRARISGSGALIDTAVLAAPFTPAPLASVFDGCNVVTAWGAQAVRVAGDGTVLDTTPWSLAGPIQAMTTDGAGTVLAVSSGQAQLLRTCAPRPTRPVFDPPPSPVAEATGPKGAVVAFTVTAHDEAGPADVVCTPASGSWFPLGTTSVLCDATHPADPSLSSSASFEVVVRDTTPPVLWLPASLVADAVAPDGATVRFSVTATDLVDPAPMVSCTPVSGGRFPIGVTAVTCNARDMTGNASPGGGFTVTVQGAPAQLRRLADLVRNLDLAPGMKTVLVATLSAADLASRSCRQESNLLSAFMVEVAVARWTGAISAARYSQLMTAAARIQDTLGCSKAN